MNELPTALVVEDEPQIRRFVRRSLEAEHWQVFEATTVRQGLVEAGTRHPQLIILDLGLPDGDGIDFLTALRAWSKVHVIVLSARSLESQKVEALDAGADDYLSKPFGVAELHARLRVALRRRSMEMSELLCRFWCISMATLFKPSWRKLSAMGVAGVVSSAEAVARVLNSAPAGRLEFRKASAPLR